MANDHQPRQRGVSDDELYKTLIGDLPEDPQAAAQLLSEGMGTRRAAEALGVDRGTVRRWATGKIRQPKPERAAKLRTAAIRSPEARKVAVQRRVADAPTTRPIHVRARGLGGPYGYSDSPRFLNYEMPGEVRDQLAAAYAEGGLDGVRQALGQACSDHYLANFAWDRLDELNITPGSR